MTASDETIIKSSMPTKDQARLMRLSTLLAVITSAFLVVIKAAAWVLTGSVAMLGTLADSLLDVFASAANFVAVRHSLVPPDEEHRFGHGKAEALAGMGQFALMMGASIFLTLSSFERVFDPKPLSQTGLGITVIIVSVIATGLLVVFQRYTINRTRSLAISADELHYRSDVFLNSAVLVSFLLSRYGEFERVDAFFGLGIALYLGIAAWRIFMRAYDELMDKEFDDEERGLIRKIAMNDPDTLAMHDLRTRRAGVSSFIQFHLELEPDISLIRSHEIADRVELKVRSAFPEADVLIHQDPAGLEEVPELERS